MMLLLRDPLASHFRANVEDPQPENLFHRIKWIPFHARPTPMWCDLLVGLSIKS